MHRIKSSYNIKVIKVLKIPLKRGPFSEAKHHYEEISYQKLTNKHRLNKLEGIALRVGRPTKLDRRKIDQLMGRN